VNRRTSPSSSFFSTKAVDASWPFCMYWRALLGLAMASRQSRRKIATPMSDVDMKRLSPRSLNTRFGLTHARSHVSRQSFSIASAAPRKPSCCRTRLPTASAPNLYSAFKVRDRQSEISIISCSPRGVARAGQSCFEARCRPAPSFFTRTPLSS
jgi:hypothetical protein